MEGYDASTYGDRIADAYDRWHFQTILDTEGTVAFLAERADGGPVLELAIGTGRVALPLRERGIEVHGIDASTRMVDKLRGKPGGADIPVTMGDFADVGVEGRYPLIFVVFNTFFALLTQEDQVRCFRNVAAHLTDEGRFVIEAFVPDLARFDRGQRTSTSHVGLDEAQVEYATVDIAEQRVDVLTAHVSAAGTRTYPVSLRYAWPSEMDLMAQLAGLRLSERWAGWRGETFGPNSGGHVSVYGKA